MPENWTYVRCSLCDALIGACLIEVGPDFWLFKAHCMWEHVEHLERFTSRYEEIRKLID